MTSPLTELPSWKELEQLSQKDAQTSIQQLFELDPLRAQKYCIQLGPLYFDYAKNRVDDTILGALLKLAESSDLASLTKAMFAGEPINTTEQRAVLHPRLRDPNTNDTSIAAAKHKIKDFASRLRSGDWVGSSGKAITDVINIGIGGSDLGPKMVCHALREYGHKTIKMHFISNVDGAEILSLLARLKPETTLVIVASKTFTTQETMLNASTTLAWFEQAGIRDAAATAHFIGLTASPESAIKFGISAERIIEFWDWVGGRYSLWSSIGLPIAIYIGYQGFEDLLAGAHRVDQHFVSAPYAENIPVIMALIGIWYNNFFGAESYAVIPYCERLGFFPSYLQQMDMESNGKHVSRDGASLNYKTGPIVWGQTGTNGQHAFFQLLHQGSALVPVDFIAAKHDALSQDDHHSVLIGNMLAQAAALMSGQFGEDTPPHKIYPGNKPSNTFIVDSLTPFSLGMLIAIYEHKVFVQGAIWQINSFDQWGVELGKAMAKSLLGDAPKNFDASTMALFEHLNN